MLLLLGGCELSSGGSPCVDLVIGDGFGRGFDRSNDDGGAVVW